MSKSFKIITRRIFFLLGVVMSLAGISPTDAKSNIQKWLELIGLDHLGGSLTPTTDRWVMWIGISIIVFWIFFFIRSRRRKSIVFEGQSLTATATLGNPELKIGSQSWLSRLRGKRNIETNPTIVAGDAKPLKFNFKLSKAVGSSHLPWRIRCIQWMLQLLLGKRNKKEMVPENDPVIFSKLYDEIVELRDILKVVVPIVRREYGHRNDEENRPSPEFLPRAKELKYKLEDLEIPSPDIVTGGWFDTMDSQDEWFHFLCELAPLAKDGKVEVAKELF